MMRGFAVALALLLAGCGGNANVQANSNGGSGASVNFPGASRFATLLSVIFLAGVSYESDQEMARAGRMPHAAQRPYSAPLPPLDPARRIAEQDCTLPIEDSAANLRCR